MFYGKYIIVDTGSGEKAILFHGDMIHKSFLEMFKADEIISAGQFNVFFKDEDTVSVKVFGESTTLGLRCRKVEDENLISQVLITC